jgi:hypothetical protein
LCLWLRRRSDLKFASFLCAVSCSLILLFPVISASDDLRAVKQEVEEPAPSKRSVKQVLPVKHSPSLQFRAAIADGVPDIPHLNWLGDVTLPTETPLIINLPEIFSVRAPPDSRS